MLIISFVEWAGAFQRPQHMAVGFARRGWNVTYVSPGYIHRRSQQIESGVELPPTLKIMNPMAFPGATKLGFVGAINESNLTRAIRRNNHRNGGAWDALIFNDPRWSGIAAEIPAKVKIFDGMDDLSAYTPDLDYLKRKEDDAIRLSSRIWTGTSIMAERLQGRHERVRFIPNGVDAEMFARPDPVMIEKAAGEIRAFFGAGVDAKSPLAGFFGALNERVDPELIGALLAENWRVLLIGPASSRRPTLPHHPSLHWTGPRPYLSLPAYLAPMDLAIIPYRTDGPHRFLYPVKALEYLAAGKPVLSSLLPDVRKFLGEFVTIGETAGDWRKIAREWNTLKPDAEARALKGQAYARSRDWNAMIDEMSGELASAGIPLAGAPAKS